MSKVQETKRANLFIVGAPKCGTTAWFEYLRQHRDIFLSDVKEPHYFAEDFPRKRWSGSYEELFARAGAEKIIGEASVWYLYSTVAAKRIREYNPDARIIMFVRQQEYFLPSLHHQAVFGFAEPVTDFESAWRLSGKRPPDTVPHECRDAKFLDYAAVGKFSEQVQRYFDEFSPEQIKIIQFDDWIADPRSTYLEILDFLGAEDDGRTEFPVINDAKTHRIKWLGKLLLHPPAIIEYPFRLLRKLVGRQVLQVAGRAANALSAKGYSTKVSPELREEIRRYYAEDNRRLAELIASVPDNRKAARQS